MNGFLIFLIKAGVGISVFYLLYHFLLRNDTFFLRNRLFLLLSLIASFIIPLINISINLPVQEEPAGYQIVVGELIQGPVSIESLIETKEFNYFRNIYGIGSGIFLLLLIYKISSLLKIYRQGRRTIFIDKKIIEIQKPYSPFSFFNIIFLSRFGTKEEEMEKIIAHEQVHIKQVHSFDVILLEIITIVQWFNPFIWLYRKALKEVHEHLADEAVIRQGYNKAGYLELLMNYSINFSSVKLANNFNYSLTKKRFKMITKIKSSKWHHVKFLVIIPFATLLFYLLGCSDTQAVDKEDKISENKKASQMIGEDTLINGKKVYYTVDVMPEFPGGQNALFKFIQENVKYHEEALKKGITGKVFVNFIITDEGQVDQVELKRGVDPLLDEEALRVVKLMPRWTPGQVDGKNVNVGFTIPIGFMANNSKTD